MNRVLVITVTDEGKGHITTGGLEADTEPGIREAIAMAEFARAQLTEVLIDLLVRQGKEQYNEQADAAPAINP